MDSENIKKAGELLEHLLGKQKAGEAGTYYSFFSHWDQLVGPELSGHSKPKDIEKGVLIIQTDHPGWMQMFQLSKERILRNIRKKYPELGIKNLRIILGNPVEQQRAGDETKTSPEQSKESEEDTAERQDSAETSAADDTEGPPVDQSSRLYTELEKLRRRVEERNQGPDE